MPSLSAMCCASTGCERPEKSISRFDGPRSIQRCSGFGSVVIVPSRSSTLASSVAVWLTSVILLVQLARTGDGKCAGWNVVCDYRARRDDRAVADLDRGHERVVHAGA